MNKQVNTFLTILSVLAILTWVFWFFNFDVRNILAKDDRISNSISQPITPPSLTVPQGQSASSCIVKFNECKLISQQKSNAQINLLKDQNVADKQSAIDFFNTWESSTVPSMERGLLKMYILSSLSNGIRLENDTDKELGYKGSLDHGSRNVPFDYPITLIAFSIKDSSWGDIQFARVVVCNNTGDLPLSSKAQIGCGNI